MGSSGCEHSATSRWGIWNATGGCCLLCACWRPVLLVRTCRDSSQCNQLRCLSLRRPVSVFRPSRDGGLSHPHQLWSVAGGHFDGRVTIWAAGVRTASLRPAGLWTTVLRTAGIRAAGVWAAGCPCSSPVDGRCLAIRSAGHDGTSHIHGGDAAVYYTDATPTKKKKKGGVCC